MDRFVIIEILVHNGYAIAFIGNRDRNDFYCTITDLDRERYYHSEIGNHSSQKGFDEAYAKLINDTPMVTLQEMGLTY